MGKKILVMGGTGKHARAIAQMIERLQSDAEVDVIIDASDDREMNGRMLTAEVQDDEAIVDVDFAKQEAKLVIAPMPTCDTLPTEERANDFKTRNKSDRKRNRASRWR